jgi:hypothetical protein
MKHILPVTLACLVAGCACKVPSQLPPEKEETPQPQPQPTPDPEPQPTGGRETGGKMKVGGCKNEHLEGTCCFMSMHAEKSSDRDPEGTTVYYVMYSVETDEKKVDLDRLCLRIPDERVNDLQKLLENNSPVPCTAYIVRPPCNPQATSVTPKIEYPDWVTEVRCY